MYGLFATPFFDEDDHCSFCQDSYRNDVNNIRNTKIVGPIFLVLGAVLISAGICLRKKALADHVRQGTNAISSTGAGVVGYAATGTTATVSNYQQPGQPAYPPPQSSYPPTQSSYPPPQSSYPPPQPSYPPPQSSYPPPSQQVHLTSNLQGNPGPNLNQQPGGYPAPPPQGLGGGYPPPPAFYPQPNQQQFAPPAQPYPPMQPQQQQAPQTYGYEAAPIPTKTGLLLLMLL